MWTTACFPLSFISVMFLSFPPCNTPVGNHPEHWLRESTYLLKAVEGYRKHCQATRAQPSLGSLNLLRSLSSSLKNVSISKPPTAKKPRLNSADDPRWGQRTYIQKVPEDQTPEIRLNFPHVMWVKTFQWKAVFANILLFECMAKKKKHAKEENSLHHCCPLNYERWWF